MVCEKNYTLCDLLRWTLFAQLNSFGVLLFCSVSVSCFFSPLTSTPELVCTIVCSVLHPRNQGSVLIWLLQVKKAAVTFIIRFLCDHSSPFLWDKCPRVQFGGCRSIHLVLWEPDKLFSTTTVPFMFPSLTNTDGDAFLYPHQHLMWSLYFSYSDRCAVTCHCESDHFTCWLMTADILQVLTCPL